jgi:hypothetical protein
MSSRGHVQVACKQGSPDLALTLLRVGCTMPALRGLPLGSALLESLVVSVMRSQHALGDDSRPTAPRDDHPGRRSSYTEQTLAAALESSFTVSAISLWVSVPRTAPDVEIFSGAWPCLDLPHHALVTAKMRSALPA